MQFRQLQEDKHTGTLTRSLLLAHLPQAQNLRGSALVPLSSD